MTCFYFKWFLLFAWTITELDENGFYDNWEGNTEIARLAEQMRNTIHHFCTEVQFFFIPSFVLQQFCSYFVLFLTFVISVVQPHERTMLIGKQYEKIVQEQKNIDKQIDLEV